MSRNAKITAFFGDGEHDFRIGVGEAEELDELFGLGLVQIYEAVAALRLPVVKAVLRVGLTGAGKKKDKAVQLVTRHLVPGEFIACADLAGRVIEASLRGAPDDPPGESKGEKEEPTSPPSQTAASASA